MSGSSSASGRSLGQHGVEAGAHTRVVSGDSIGRASRDRAAGSSSRLGPPRHRPTWAEIDLNAIASNVAALRAGAGGADLMAVVKADGYGHGMIPAAQAALAGGADWLAVALVEEGEALRAAGITVPVLVMTEPPSTAIAAMIDADLTPTVYSGAFVDALAGYARDIGRPVSVHCKLDTGMRRVGVPDAEWESALTRLRDEPALRLAGLWSHFAVADEPDHPFIAEQRERFARGLALAGELGATPDVVHLANSAATLSLPDTHYDVVRPGLSVYGLEPAPGLAAGRGLRPAMRWCSRLGLVKRLAAGEAVSYGLRWRAPHETTTGTVPAGYADGVTRALSNTGEVVCRGQRVPIVGTVCMDQFMVDLGEADAEAGDEVVLLGDQGAAAVTADDWAAWLATINYEVVCGVGRRVPRVYVGGERAR
jgi:alanine racemase